MCTGTIAFTRRPASAIAQSIVAALAAFAQNSRDARGVHLPIVRLGVDEDRPRLRVAARIRRRDERERRDEHLVIRLHSHEQRDVQRRRAIHGRDRVRRAGACARAHASSAIDELPTRRHPAGVETLLT